MGQQTVIAAGFAADISLDNFHGENNRVLLHELKRLAAGEREQPILYLWGASGCGKTHLLQGCRELAQSLQRRAQYINLQQSNPAALSAHTEIHWQLTCLDGITPDSIADGQNLFSFYEQIKAGGGGLVMAGSAPPASLGIELKDLESRLAAGGGYAVQSINDGEKRVAIIERAHERGFELSANVADFILSRYGRDEKSLFALLDRLDHESLKSQRRITIPFLKTLLGEAPI